MLPDSMFAKTHNSWRGTKQLYTPFAKPYKRHIFQKFDNQTVVSTPSTTVQINNPSEHDLFMRLVIMSPAITEAKYQLMANGDLEYLTFENRMMINNQYYLKNIEGFESSNFGTFFINMREYFKIASCSVAFMKHWPHLKEQHERDAAAYERQQAAEASKRVTDAISGMIRRQMADAILFDEYKNRFK